MESSWADPNLEEYFQYLVEGVNNWECDFSMWRENSYIHKTKHGVICVYKNPGIYSSR